MSHDLHRALHDLADSETLAPLDSDLWNRGRAVRRHRSTVRLQLAAACVVMVAVLVGLGMLGRAWVVAEPAAPSDVPDGGALPAEIHSPGGRAAHWRSEDGARGELAPKDGFDKFGRVSAVLTRPNLLPVIVSAEDGRHWLPVLPDQTADHAGEPPVSLSPDGWKLAYTWVVTGESTAETEAGLAIVDLHSGTISRVALTGHNQRPIRVEELGWSPDGTQIGWLGDEAVAWDDGMWSSRGRAVDVGVSSLDNLEATSFVVEKGHQGNDAIAVTNTGRLFYIGNKRLWAFDEGPAGSWGLDGVGGSVWSTAAVDHDGRRLVVGLNSTGYADSSASGVVYFDLHTNFLTGTIAGTFDPWEGPESSETEPLGFSPEGSLVASVQRRNGLQPGSVAVQVKDVSGRIRTLTRAPADTLGPISVATALADQPAVEFPEPDWPMSDERKILLVTLVLAAVLLPIGVVVRLRRQRALERHRY